MAQVTDLRDGELGVCIVGAGDIGNVYLHSWQNTEGGTVVSVADMDAERAEKAAREYGAESWDISYKEAVAADGVDIVTVCAPTMLHPEMTIHAAQQGKHVLCVKPIALALEDADRMIEVAEKSGVQLCVGFMRRFTPTTALVRRMLGSGRIGRPVLYRVDVANAIRPKILMHAKHANGGPIIDMCCHYFDVARVYFESEPVKVMAQGMMFAEGKSELAGIRDLAVDTGAIIVTYASGDILAVSICWGLPPNQDWTGGEEIWAPVGSLGRAGAEA